MNSAVKNNNNKKVSTIYFIRPKLWNTLNHLIQVVISVISGVQIQTCCHLVCSNTVTKCHCQSKAV